MLKTVAVFLALRQFREFITSARLLLPLFGVLVADETFTAFFLSVMKSETAL